jgi:hypothetical protein
VAVLSFKADFTPRIEFFVARTYLFDSHLQRPYSLGFTVPDPDSEEEGLVAHSGSQRDPLVIDDSDAASDQSEVDEDDLDNTATGMADYVQQDEPSKPLSPPREEYPESALPITIAGGYDRDEGMHVFASHRDDSVLLGSHSDSAEGEDEPLETDFDSEAGSIGSSEISYDSELEVQDSEEEDARETGYTNAFASSSTQEVKPSSTLSMPTEQSSITSPPAIQPAFYHQLYDGNSMPNGSRFADSPQASMKMPEPSNKLSNESAPTPAPHDQAPEPATEYLLWDNSPYGICSQQAHQQNWYTDEAPFGYLVDRAPMFSPAAPPPAQESVEARASVSSLLDNFSGPMFQTNQIQTPPLMPLSDVDTSVPPQPGRRTKVTIEEIVEEQPLTPESVNNMKRKAEVLEEIEPTDVQESAMASEEAAVITEAVRNEMTANSTAVETAVMIAQRPKKVPRSILSKVLGKATYPLLSVTGAAVSFALLSTLPDSFFT